MDIGPVAAIWCKLAGKWETTEKTKSGTIGK